MTTLEVAYVVNSTLWSLLGLMVGYVLGQLGNIAVREKGRRRDDS